MPMSGAKHVLYYSPGSKCSIIPTDVTSAPRRVSYLIHEAYKIGNESPLILGLGPGSYDGESD
jgi:hypothetical protein